MSKPAIPQGTRDFSAETVRKRNHILDTIRTVFELFGFEPLETPAMENLDTLMGKYGEEGDRLIFKILNNGINDPKNIEKAKEGFEKVLQGKNSKDLTERALKYDLTIPFARYVAMNHGLLTFPYKRYQVQPVWRADRPQKGRYREFTQCDADVVGSNSLLNETELANIYHEVFTRLGIKEYRLCINSRKILAALAAKCGSEDRLTDITIAIDKLDKIGLEKVIEELRIKNLESAQLQIIKDFLSIKGSNEEILKKLVDLLGAGAREGCEELSLVALRTSHINLNVDPTLARGLNYYTGIIFEVKAPANISMGSIGGGGRYDDLTGSFGVPGIPGVGISFGVDRIYDVMEEMGLFPENLQQGVQVLFFNLGSTESQFAYECMQLLRKEGISAELYHEQAKMDKQFKYAEKKRIGHVVIIGSEEMKESGGLPAGRQVKVKVKELSTGQQEEVPAKDLANYFLQKQKNIQ